MRGLIQKIKEYFARVRAYFCLDTYKKPHMLTTMSASEVADAWGIPEEKAQSIIDAWKAP